MRLLTLRDAVRARFQAASLCYGQGTANACQEATALVLGVTGLSEPECAANPRLQQALVAQVQALAERRIRERLPLTYLLGRSRYCGQTFCVEAGLVTPRSSIGPMLLEQFRPWLRQPPARVLDLCCGTGCLGLLAALQFPEASVTLSDLAPEALALAARNTAALQLEARVRIVASDLRLGLPDGRYDLILCNPPYVDAPDMRTLPPEFAAEPALGLAGGETGLDLIAPLIERVAAHLTPAGLLVCEVGMTAWRVRRAWPHLPLIWPDQPAGAACVFLLEGAALASHTALPD